MDRTPNTFPGTLPNWGPKGKQKVTCRMQKYLKKKEIKRHQMVNEMIQNRGM